jgi:glycosyltransferase involved in cell wall biosynthesis
MTVIFVAYQDFHSNSSIQIFSLANRMAGLGHRVHVCVPGGKQTATLLGVPQFACCTYDEALAVPHALADSAGLTVIHAWTPREHVRKFSEQLRSELRCPLLVHLEDNEDVVTSANLGQDLEHFRAQPPHRLDQLIPEHLSHPHRFREFLSSSTGVTMLIDRLSEFVPDGKPQHVFWPAYDDLTFREMPLLLEERRQHGIQDDEIVLSYTGHVTNANRAEVASIYLAVAMLRRLGHPARLLRTGLDCVPVFPSVSREMQDAVISLGVLDHAELPKVLGMANFLVQPGKANAFNDYRFPSKLPEFFSIGRPVLLPETNLGRFVRDGVDAVLLREGHAMEIVDRLLELIHDPEKQKALCRAALDFCHQHFNWSKAAKGLIDFYESVETPVPG